MENNTNYTATQTAEMVADYQAGVSTKTIAENLGKSERSVIAKLSREGVYVSKTRATAPRVTKAQLVAAIAAAAATGVDLSSLEKASLEALQALAGWATKQ